MYKSARHLLVLHTKLDSLIWHWDGVVCLQEFRPTLWWNFQSTASHGFLAATRLSCCKCELAKATCIYLWLYLRNTTS